MKDDESEPREQPGGGEYLPDLRGWVLEGESDAQDICVELRAMLGLPVDATTISDTGRELAMVRGVLEDLDVSEVGRGALELRLRVSGGRGELRFDRATSSGGGVCVPGVARVHFDGFALEISRVKLDRFRGSELIPTRRDRT